MAVTAPTSTVGLVAEALSEHADAALVMLSAARSVLNPEASIAPSEQIGAAIGAVRTAVSGLQIGGLDENERLRLLNAAAEALASGTPTGDCGPPICLPHIVAASVPASARTCRNAWTADTVAEGVRRPDTRNPLPAAEMTAWILDVATTSSLGRRHVPIVVDSAGEPLSLTGPDTKQAADHAELLQSLLRTLVANGTPSALAAKPAVEVWPFDAHPRTWARAGVLRSSIEAAGEAFTRTSRAVRLAHAAALSAQTGPFVGVFAPGMIEETYEGSAFGWVWACNVLSATPDSDFVQACAATVDGSWADRVADTAVAAVAGWIAAGGHNDSFPALAEDLSEMRRMLSHVARHSVGVCGAEHNH